MKKRYLLFSLAILFTSTFVFAQVEQKNVDYLPYPKYPELFKTIPLLNDESPDWVKLMYSGSPNFYEVETAYEQFYRENEFKKTTHTQNYRYWSRIVGAEGYLQPDGSIYMPTTEEKRESEFLLKEKYKKYSNKGITSGNWQCIGPFETYDTDGITKKSAQVNIYCFSQSLSNSNVLYAGAEDGGVFKSIDKGLNWTVIAEDHSLGGIQVLEVDPTNDNIVYMATGERLYKTTDGGVTWAILEDINDNNISDISIYPTNTQIVLTAGKLGLKRSTDGGVTWTTIIADRCWDIELKTDDPNTVLVSKYNPTKVITEIWKSIDNGLTFAAKVTGWYDPVAGVASATDGARIGVTDADPNRVYVILLGTENDAVNDNNYIGVYRSDDAGETWSSPYDGDGDGNPDNEPGGPYSDDHWCFTSFHPTFDWGGYYNQGFWDLAIGVSDTDEDKFLVGSLNLFKSEDGGVTYNTWGGYQCDNCTPGYRHPDQQEIEINGSDVWVASDGGIDLYDGNLNRIEARNNGMSGSNFWGFGQGWNEDVVTGGKYHNGNCAHHENYGSGNFIALGGGETPTGYVNQGENRKVQHSDISGKLLPATLTGGVSDITKYSTFPNQAYISNDKSEIVTHPSSWNILYLGKENKVLKSEDGGSSFNEIGTFGTVATDIVLGIEISRNNPEVIYAVQKIQWCAKLWKTTNGGANWNEVTIPDCTSSIFISVSASDENVIFLAVHLGSTETNKIFKSTNGGTSWTNISDPIFDNETPKCIQVQDGTDGGVYVVTDKKVYYKNNTIGWQLFSDGLPAKMQYIGFIPFYRDGKVRLATMNRGIWESPFYETSTPIAQPMLNTANSFCVRDTLFFENYSICAAGATFSWSFSTTPQWISSTTARNPKVKFGAAGTYSATLIVTDANGTDTKTVTDIVTITAECDPETLPGSALNNPGGGSDRVVGPPLNITTNNITFSAWIKRNGNQNDVAGIIFFRGATTGSAGLHFGSSNDLRHHWNSGNYNWSSGLIVPDGVWTHVALVIEPDKATFYMNGEASVHTGTKDVKVFDADMLVGADINNSSRVFDGLIDEVCVFSASLTQEQIRDLMYKTLDPSSIPDLIRYYQFNRSSGIITDRAGIAHAEMNGNATRASSTAPVPYRSITDGDWSSNTTWDTDQNAPANDWARAKIENSVSLDQDQTLESLEITSTGTLTVDETKNLTVGTDGLQNDSGSDGVVLKSDATGTASMIVEGTASGNITQERYASGNYWHYFASPVAGQLLNNDWLSNNSIVSTPAYQFFGWDEPTNYWIIYDDALFLDTQFETAKGYAATRSADGDLNFSGTVRTSAVNYPATFTTGKGNGNNLIGNPFTSSIAITEDAQVTDNFLADNATILDDNYQAIYIWQESSDYSYGKNDYSVICNTGFSGQGSTAFIDQDYVQPGQAFMVKVKQAGNIVFDANIRKHGTADFYKSKESWPGVELRVSNNTHSNSTIIAFNHEMTQGLDPSYDVVKLKGNPNLALYTNLVEPTGKDYAVQALPDQNIEEYIIPIGVDVLESAVFEFSIYQENLDNYNIVLEDRQENTFTNLRWDSYFATISESGTGRFYLHFKDATGVEEITPESNINFKVVGGNVLIGNPDLEKGTLTVLNMAGQVLNTLALDGNPTQEFGLKQPAGIYIFSIQTQKTKVSKKVFIK